MAIAWDAKVAGLKRRVWAAVALVLVGAVIAYGHITHLSQGTSPWVYRLGWLSALVIILVSARPPEEDAG